MGHEDMLEYFQCEAWLAIKSCRGEVHRELDYPLLNYWVLVHVSFMVALAATPYISHLKVPLHNVQHPIFEMVFYLAALLFLIIVLAICP